MSRIDWPAVAMFAACLVLTSAAGVVLTIAIGTTGFAWWLSPRDVIVAGLLLTMIISQVLIVGGLCKLARIRSVP